MDYDDLVDQFIVNGNEPQDGEAEAEAEVEVEVEVEVEDKSKENSEILLREQIKIHAKNLIESRQELRRREQMEKVKERNKTFKGVTRGSVNSNSNVAAGGYYSYGNSEKRRRILRVEGERVEGNEPVEGNKPVENNPPNLNVSIDPNVKEDVEELIPCRLELDYEGYRLSDVLLLPSDPVPSALEVEAIASQLCQDFDLPSELFLGGIVKSLRDQIEEWHVYQGALAGMKVPYEEIGPIPIRLDVIVGLHRFEDRLEVSLDPREANTVTMRNLVAGLESPDEGVLSPGEFESMRPLLLHNLLEQLMLWRKAIVFGGFHRDARSGQIKFHDGDAAVMLNDSSRGSMTGVRRHFADTNTFTPVLGVLGADELDRIEAGREREGRRRRRTVTTGAAATKRAAGLVNNLAGTVRSPPRTMPTPASYRGSVHRITRQSLPGSDDESAEVPRKRNRRRT